MRFLSTLVVLALVAAWPARAADSYAIDLQVPSAQRELLENNLDLYRWQGNAQMSEVGIRRLVLLAPQQVRDLLSTEGFFSPTVEARIALQDGKPLVVLKVDPGSPTLVAEVDLRVTGAFDDGSSANGERLAHMETAWSLPVGAVFRQGEWESAKRNALNALLIERFPRASIADSTAEVDPENHAAKLKVTLDSGPAVSFGDVQIEGLKRYPEGIVRDVNPIKAGEPYSQSRLLELQTRLQNSPYFSSVGVAIDGNATPDNTTGDNATAELPVRVEVDEQPAKKLGFGIGMSTDTGPRGQIDYRDLNVRDRAWLVGGTLKLARVNQSLAGNLQLPPSGPFHDSLDALLERTDIEGQETRKIVLGAKRSIVEGTKETVYSLRYWTERQYVDNESNTLNQALSLSFARTWRKVDSLIFPTRGYLLNVQADGASQALLSSQSFVRGYVRGTAFYPLGERNQFILRGELGAVAADSTKGIPSDFLFRTGGDKSVRGYAFQSLGVADGSAVVGGRYVAVASAEYVRWVSEKWGAAFFVDHGGAGDNRRDIRMVTGYGVGARWKSPVGPLNVDVAYGQQERKYRLHFSVGFSF